MLIVRPTSILGRMPRCSVLLLCLALTACAAPPLVAPASSPSVIPRQAISPPLPSPVSWQERLAVDVQQAQAQLTFWPLVPSYMPSDVRGQVEALAGCGIGPSRCIDYRFESPSGSLVLLVLQGPAGCCLDSARPGATRTIDIRPGIRAHYDPVEPQFGGPILWWVEDTARGQVYVALNSPVISQDELIRIASSMRPLPGMGR